jgi:hypothetical protein
MACSSVNFTLRDGTSDRFETRKYAWIISAKYELRSENTFTMHTFSVIYLHLQQEQFNRTAIRWLFHIVPTITDTFITSWDELLYSLLLAVRALHYRPSYRNCFHLAIILNSWPPKFYFSVGNGWQSLGEYFHRYKHNQCRFLQAIWTTFRTDPLTNCGINFGC